jgi:hypothetical protein
MKAVFRVVVLSMIIGLCGSSGAMAQGPKPWIFSWGADHWANLNFEKPYLEEGKPPHNSQWSHIDWAPQDWLAQHDNELTLIHDFYRAGIITDQYVKRKWFGLGAEIIPVLEVGPAFYRLGGRDKRRVTDTFDTVYGITGNKVFGMYVLEDSITHKQIGTYTQYGLSIQ